MEKLLEVSNPDKAYKNAKKYLGKDVKMYISTNKNKKYMIINPSGKKVHFGSILYEDFTKHKDKLRQKSYLARSAGIKGNWKNDPYSPNNLSRNILW